jgi:hypothetical protein
MRITDQELGLCKKSDFAEYPDHEISHPLENEVIANDAKTCRAVATVVALPSATPHPGGFKRRPWHERLSIRGSSRRFPVAPPVVSESWLLTI